MATVAENLQTMKTALKAEYSYLTENEVGKLYDKAVSCYCDFSFPFDHSITTIPEDRPRGVQWVHDCMVEILERSGCSSYVAYAENGLSLEFDNSQISRGLLKRLIPCVGV